MSETMESTGKTVDEAIREALLRMGLRREEVDITILQRERGGLFGLGRRQAVVRVQKKSGGRRGEAVGRDRDADRGGRGGRGGRAARSGGGGRSSGGGRATSGEGVRLDDGEDREERRRSSRRRGGRGRGRRRDDGDGGQPQEEKQEARSAGRSEGRQDDDRGRDDGENRRGRRRRPRRRRKKEDDAVTAGARNGESGGGGRDQADDRDRDRDRREDREQPAAAAPTREEAPTRAVEADREDARAAARDETPGEATAREATPRERGDGERTPREERPAAHAAPSAAPAASDEDQVLAVDVKASERVQPFGAGDASDVPALLEKVASGLMVRCGFVGRAQVQEGEYHQVKLVVDDRSAAVLIGRHGQSIEAVDLLVQQMASHAAGDRLAMNLDINNYRARRDDGLIMRARNAAAEARNTGEKVELPPMHPRERRVVHLEIVDLDDVATYTVDGPDGRYVVVCPADQVPTEDGEPTERGRQEQTASTSADGSAGTGEQSTPAAPAAGPAAASLTDDDDDDEEPRVDNDDDDTDDDTDDETRGNR